MPQDALLKFKQTTLRALPSVRVTTVLGKARAAIVPSLDITLLYFRPLLLQFLSETKYSILLSCLLEILVLTWKCERMPKVFNYHKSHAHRAAC